MITLTVRDETTAGEQLAALELQLAAEETTVRELIRARVHQEVRDHNATLVTPRNRGRVDAGKQTDVALEAFERGHVLVLVDDRQVETLDESVTLRSGSVATFLKLVPLVGG